MWTEPLDGSNRLGFDPKRASPMDNHLTLLDLVAPRPIAMISSTSADGIRNVAPFSYFMAVTPNPLTLAIAMGLHLDGAPKDTYLNAIQTGEFVVNVTGEVFRDALEKVADTYGPEVDEFAVMGWTPCPSIRVAPPSVREAPASLECEVRQVIDVGTPDVALSHARLVIAEVVYITLRPELLDDRGRVDPIRLGAIGSLGMSSYLRTDPGAVYELEHRGRAADSADAAAREGAAREGAARAADSADAAVRAAADAQGVSVV